MSDETINPDSFLGDVEKMLNEALGYPAGTRALMDVCARYAGLRVYVPSKTRVFVEFRNRCICDEFKGHNVSELALKWGLSEGHVRQILKR